MEILCLDAIVHSIRTLVDGTLSLTIQTQEIRPEDMTKLFRLRGKFGHMAFKPTKITEEDIIGLPTEMREFKNDKTPSERLRNVIYRYWETTSKKDEFDAFYKRHIESLINRYKEKLL